MKLLTISAADGRQRLDKYLRRVFPEASTGFLYKMLRKKNITLNGKKAGGSEILQEGDVLSVYFSDNTFELLSGTKAGRNDFRKDEYVKYQNADLPMPSVLYETEDYLVINKPSGLLSQPDASGTVSADDLILSYLIRSQTLSYADFLRFRPSAAHRLDRNTSGVLAAAKTVAGAQNLSEWFSHHLACKDYLCICEGIFGEKARLVGYWSKNKKENRVTITKVRRSDRASEVITIIEPIAFSDDMTLLHVSLVTGKSHQIRAHLASVGHPLLGDLKYGGFCPKGYPVSFGQALHAQALTLPNGSIVCAPMPEEMQRIADTMQVL